jgi:Concanavalin A-like lectin/glucanases superfamily
MPILMNGRVTLTSAGGGSTISYGTPTWGKNVPSGNTVLLLDGNFSDLSDSAHTVTPQSGASTTSSTVWVGNTSINITPGQYASVSDSSDFDFTSSSFTIEFWFKSTGNGRMCLFSGPYDHWIGADMNYAGSYNINLWVGNGDAWSVLTGDIGGGQSGVGRKQWIPGQWNHWAVSYDGTTYRTYMNGVLDVNVASSTHPVVAAGDKKIGIWGNYGIDFNGQIGATRWVKGAALYTGATIQVPQNRYLIESIGATVSSPASGYIKYTDQNGHEVVYQYTPDGVPA